jgi:hypothetical protein
MRRLIADRRAPFKKTRLEGMMFEKGVAPAARVRRVYGVLPGLMEGFRMRRESRLERAQHRLSLPTFFASAQPTVGAHGALQGGVQCRDEWGK